MTLFTVLFLLFFAFIFLGQFYNENTEQQVPNDEEEEQREFWYE